MLRRAFTMVEMLVVIAIIAVLAAILFPVFARAKAAAKQSVCISNLHQIGSAITLYMADYDDLFPNAIDASDKYDPNIWDQFPEYKARIPFMPLMPDVLQPYIKSKEVFKCPSDIGTQVLDTHFPDRFLTQPSMYETYGSSYFFRTEIAFKAFSQTGFQIPANINVFFDGGGHWHGSGRALRADDDFLTMGDLLTGYRYNCLFGDMHVKSVTHDTMSQAWATPL